MDGSKDLVFLKLVPIRPLFSAHQSSSLCELQTHLISVRRVAELGRGLRMGSTADEQNSVLFCHVLSVNLTLCKRWYLESDTRSQCVLKVDARSDHASCLQ